jgi:small basic protein
MQEDQAAKAIFDKLKQGLGQYSVILETHDRLMRVLGAALGVVLAAVWILRLPIDTLFQTTLLAVCVVATLYACIGNSAKSSLTHAEGLDVFAYQRRGVSWSFLVSGLLGSAIVFTALRFLIENGIPSSPSASIDVALLAALVTVLIVPGTPLLANLQKVRFLKTSLKVMIGTNGERRAHSSLHICSADQFAPTQAEQDEILRLLNATFSGMTY